MVNELPKEPEKRQVFSDNSLKIVITIFFFIIGGGGLALSICGMSIFVPFVWELIQYPTTTIPYLSFIIITIPFIIFGIRICFFSWKLVFYSNKESTTIKYSVIRVLLELAYIVSITIMIIGIWGLLSTLNVYISIHFIELIIMIGCLLLGIGMFIAITIAIKRLNKRIVNK